jgi:hypothetical protein
MIRFIMIRILSLQLYHGEGVPEHLDLLGLELGDLAVEQACFLSIPLPDEPHHRDAKEDLNFLFGWVFHNVVEDSFLSLQTLFVGPL